MLSSSASLGGEGEEGGEGEGEEAGNEKCESASWGEVCPEMCDRIGVPGVYRASNDTGERLIVIIKIDMMLRDPSFTFPASVMKCRLTIKVVSMIFFIRFGCAPCFPSFELDEYSGRLHGSGGRAGCVVITKSSTQAAPLVICYSSQLPFLEQDRSNSNPLHKIQILLPICKNMKSWDAHLS